MYLFAIIPTTKVQRTKDTTRPKNIKNAFSGQILAKIESLYILGLDRVLYTCIRANYIGIKKGHLLPLLKFVPLISLSFRREPFGACRNTPKGRFSFLCSLRPNLIWTNYIMSTFVPNVPLLSQTLPLVTAAPALPSWNRTCATP